MKPLHLYAVCIASLLISARVLGATHYVNANGTNAVLPYLSWATAATNIQQAVDIAQTSDTILVTNGIYDRGGRLFSGSSNRIAIDSKVLTIQSVNGPAVTTIKGYQLPGVTNGTGAIRCIFLTSGSVLYGFTLTNGATYGQENGGGVKCESLTTTVTNCVILGNSAVNKGGGAYSGTLINCVVSDNAVGGSGGSGGGVSSSKLINCLLTRNFSPYIAGGAEEAILNNCTVASNSAAAYAGAAWNCTLTNSIVYYNNSYTNNPDDSGSYGTWVRCCAPFVPVLGSGNFTNPPLFVNLSQSDYHLAAPSPCINAGTNSANTNSMDLDGNPRIVAGLIDTGAFEFQSLIHYVALNNLAPIPPYTNWVNAATNIQDAIDASAAGDLVLVSNGVYKTGGRAVYGQATNRVVVNKAMILQSVNGPVSTAIQGDFFHGGGPVMRCIYLTNGALLNGFTLTNGGLFSLGDNFREQSGGAAWCESNNVTITNCVIVRSSAPQFGGGVYQGTLYNCSLSNNSAFITGGGAYGSILNHCTVSSNRVVQGIGGGGSAFGALDGCLIAYNSGFSGGGTYASTLTDCILSNNSATFGGGAFFGTLNNCLISSNFVGSFGAGVYSNVLNNCILINNRTPGSGGGAYRSTLNSCTIVSNTASSSGGGALQSILNNSIAFYNTAASDPNFYSTNLMRYCCTTPLPTNGLGNITNEPIFVNLTNLDLHLQSNSPCINSGNNSFVTTATDFDVNPRIINNTVDIGAYEFQSPTSVLSYAWARQYGLPLDGSADFLDTDGDGLNNWQEWRAGTDPTSASSVLAASAPAVDPVTGVTITWQSVTNVTYYIQRAPDLNTPFSSIQSNILGQVGTTSYIDTNIVSVSSFLYRVGVQ